LNEGSNEATRARHPLHNRNASNPPPTAARVSECSRQIVDTKTRSSPQAAWVRCRFATALPFSLAQTSIVHQRSL
jgi:hypothetical protein